MTTSPPAAESLEENPALDWLDAVPMEMRQIALRHGKDIYRLAMQTGAIAEAINLTLTATQGHPKVAGPLRTLVRNAGDLAADLLTLKGLAPPQLLACRRDLDAFFKLQNSLQTPTGAGTQVKSPGGIILQS